jgi:hypothetical protein
VEINASLMNSFHHCKGQIRHKGNSVMNFSSLKKLHQVSSTMITKNVTEWILFATKKLLSRKHILFYDASQNPRAAVHAGK